MSEPTPTTDATPPPAAPRAARVAPTREVVAAGALFARMLRGYFALSKEVDDAERQYGPKLYGAMMHDPVAGGSVDMLRQKAIREPRLAPPKALRAAPGGEPAPEQARAAEVAAFCERALHRPERPLVETLYEFTYGLVEDKLAEVVLEKVAEGPDAGRLAIGAFKFKPRQSWRWVVDAYGNAPMVAGMLPMGEEPPPGGDAAVVPGAGGRSVLLDAERFAVFAWGARDSDPRGYPILRRAYNAWNLKQRTWPEKLKGDSQFGTPSVAAIMPEDAVDPDPDQVAGLKLPDGSPVRSAEDLMLYNVLGIANGTGGVFPFGTTITVVESARGGSDLNGSIELYNREIAAAILHAARTTQEAKHGSKADSESSGDVTDVLIDLIRAMLCGLIRNVLRYLVRLNFGPLEAATMVPEVAMGDAVAGDRAALITAFGAWVPNATEAQLPYIDAELDLPPRQPGDRRLADLAAERAAAQAQAEPDGDETAETTEPAPKPKGASK